MKAWIFSDLHLTSSADPLYRSFLKVLDEPCAKGDQVILAGDIFDLMVGESRYFKHKFSEFFQSIERLVSRGIGVTYLEGNHDFSIRALFPKSVHFYDHEVRFVDAKLFVAHGDCVDEEDYGYLRLRSLFRSSLFQGMVNFVPGTFVEWVGKQFSRPLEKKVQDLPEQWSDEARSTLRTQFRSYAERIHRQGFDAVVLGHCHDLDEVKPYYFNMGYPPVHRQFLIFDSSASLEKELLKRRNFPGI